MGKQSELERISIAERTADDIQNQSLGHTTISTQPYDADHDDAKYTGSGDLKGKNTNVSPIVPDQMLKIPTSKGTYPGTPLPNQTVVTTDGGGEYDRFGTIGVEGAFQGNSGREYLIGTSGLNPYSPQNIYDENSVIISSTKGQYVVS